MKLIKLIFAVFVISVLFGIAGVNALDSEAFHGISVPSLGGTFTSDSFQKTRDYYNQYFYTVTTNKPSKARVTGCINNNLASSWQNAVVDSNVYWTDAGCEYSGNYKFQLKAQSYNILSFSYWGLWVFNPAS